ncbi:MAG: DUF3611 family protein [Cyanosarcina radialis HA8281-LM2]|jgi:heme/copper-type cytochrome/quinol oxidase subunit 4|nr:DUF3611 family protein [Cyanosarcina radialis HA8281-LM2]
MSDFLSFKVPNPTTQQIAQSFRWLGWLGFWLQVLLGFIPILVVVTTILFSPNQGQLGLSFGMSLAIVCLLVLCFSIYWCYRYTRVGNKLKAPDLRPAKANVIRDLKVGLIANLGTIGISVLIALLRVGELTFKMLRLPQGATVVTPAPVGTTIAPGALITASNMITIQATINAIAAGLVGAIVALLLLYQVGRHHSSSN